MEVPSPSNDGEDIVYSHLISVKVLRKQGYKWIDIDCIESERPYIFKYIIDRFGEDKTARVLSFGTLKSLSVIDGVVRYFNKNWIKENPNIDKDKNPYTVAYAKTIKQLFNKNPEEAYNKYPDVFKYHDGLFGIKESLSVHPAGIVISPITLPDHYGSFDKDGEKCLMLDMENVHDYTGLSKYDFLALKTLKVIKGICDDIGTHYPLTHEFDWNDEKVWADMVADCTGIFQLEGAFAHDCVKRFNPKNIFDLCLVTACIRPSGSSYRDDLLARKIHKNPSKIIDDLLENNLGLVIAPLCSNT